MTDIPTITPALFAVVPTPPPPSTHWIVVAYYVGTGKWWTVMPRGAGMVYATEAAAREAAGKLPACWICRTVVRLDLPAGSNSPPAAGRGR